MVYLNTLKSANVEIMISGRSAKARGYDATLLLGFNAVFSMPDQLIKCSLEADIALFLVTGY